MKTLILIVNQTEEEFSLVRFKALELHNIAPSLYFICSVVGTWHFQSNFTSSNLKYITHKALNPFPLVRCCLVVLQDYLSMG